MSLVVTPCGQVRGITSASGASTFRGIRFATAARLQPPVLVTAWSGILEAVQIGPECPQTESQLRTLLNADNSGQSEDCLFLNITCSAEPISLRPVYVWIHGGGFTNITPPLSWNDSERLSLDGNAVVVTLSYRLGAFGFLGDLNLGILDQVCALQWVHDNIESFGGDPQNVTIFGESAGGCSVIALLASPLTTGLIAHAWAMSASLGQLRTSEIASSALQLFLKAANVSSVEDLASLSTEKFLQAQDDMLKDVENWAQGFSPTADGNIIPLNILQAAANNPVDLVIGTTHDESRIFNLLNADLNNLDEDQALQVLISNHQLQAREIWDLYRKCYPTYSPTQIIAAVDTDTHFKLHMWKLLRLRPISMTNTWSYTFSWNTPIFDSALGASHGLDIPFIFNNTDLPRVHIYTGTDPSRALLATEMSQSLLSLGRSDTPNWTPYEQNKRSTKIFDMPSLVVDSSLASPDNLIYDYWMKT